MQLPLTGSEPVDELIEHYPRAGAWLAQQGVVCTQCGEVVWGSLAELFALRRLDAITAAAMLEQLNSFLAQPE